MIENPKNIASEEALSRLIIDQIEQGRRRRERRATVRARAIPTFGARRRDSLEGYVVCIEIGEATIMGEGGMFSFQTPSRDLTVGQRVRFVREGGEFTLV